MSSALKLLLFSFLLVLSISVHASSLTEEFEVRPIPLHLKVLKELLKTVEKEELGDTPDLKELIESYHESNGKALYPPILLHRLKLELERRQPKTQGYDAFFKETYLKGFYALYIFLNNIQGNTKEALYNWSSFFSTLKEKSRDVKDSSPVLSKLLEGKYNFAKNKQIIEFGKNIFSEVTLLYPTQSIRAQKPLARKMLSPLNLGSAQALLTCNEEALGKLSMNSLYTKNYFLIQVGSHQFPAAVAQAFSNIGREDEEVMWMKRCAGTGSVDAMFNLSLYYADCNNFKESRAWLQKAADKDDIQSLYNLGDIDQKGNQIERAMEYFEKASQLGSCNAMNSLAFLHDKQGNLEGAEFWYKKAAQSGNVLAMSNLASLYFTQDRLNKATDWCEKAAQLGNVFAMNNFGILFYKNGEIDQAIGWLKKAVDKGSMVALYNIGVLYQEKGEIDLAMHYFEKAHLEGHSFAILRLAETFSDAELEKKIALYKEAIEDNLDGATALYVAFLMRVNRLEEAQDYEEFLGIEDVGLSERAVDGSKEDEAYDANQESALQEEKDANLLEEGHDTLSDNESKDTVFYYGEYGQEENFKIPSLSKRTLQKIERAKEKLSLTTVSPSSKEISHRTYRDIAILVDPDAVSEVGLCSVKVKGLLSSLANGEGRRGKLELLKGHDDLYSMRITKSDRLVFRILEGNLKTGIKRLQILCAKGHYSTLSGTRLSRDRRSCQKL